MGARTQIRMSVVGPTLGRVYQEESPWDEAEKLEVRVMQMRKILLGSFIANKYR